MRSELRVCFLGTFGVTDKGGRLPSCDGRLIRAHLIPRQTLRRAGGNEWDSRSWVWACGGPMGNAGHHGMLDSSRTLRLPRASLPPDTEELALELGLIWWLDRTYGTKEAQWQSRK